MDNSNNYKTLGTYNTLQELASALNDDNDFNSIENFSETFSISSAVRYRSKNRSSLSSRPSPCDDALTQVAIWAARAEQQQPKPVKYYNEKTNETQYKIPEDQNYQNLQEKANVEVKKACDLAELERKKLLLDEITQWFSTSTVKD